jgi:hypothetical protein
LKEIDRLEPRAVLEDLSKMNEEMPDIALPPPDLLVAIAAERQTFYKNNQPNAWLNSLVKPPTAHASH